jgi:hypothetical protein
VRCPPPSSRSFSQVLAAVAASIEHPSTPPLSASPPSSPEHQPAKRPKADRHVKGSKITLSAKVTEEFYEAKAKVEASMPPRNNKLSAGGMVGWLLNEVKDTLKGLQNYMQAWLPDPRPSRKDVQPGVASLAPGISPGRVLPALGKPDTIKFYMRSLNFWTWTMIQMWQTVLWRMPLPVKPKHQRKRNDPLMFI